MRRLEALGHCLPGVSMPWLPRLPLLDLLPLLGLSAAFLSRGINSCIPRPSDGSLFVKTSDIFSLDSIRSTLVRQEETIIFALIERSQFFTNGDIYDCKVGHFRNVYGTPLSFLEYMLLETEKLHAKVRRYTSPEETPFFPSLLPTPILTPLNYPQLLTGKNEVNVNTELLRWYVEKIIKRLCKPGDDEQHGSSVLCDINCLQALSRRVHYGRFVAESKFRENTERYTELVKASDVAGIINELTNVEVERRVLRRAFVKASTYGQDITGVLYAYFEWISFWIRFHRGI